MMNVHPAPHGAGGALGLLGPPAPSAPTSGAAAARGPRGRQAFEDDLDASLARGRKDGDDSAPLDASATAATPPRVMEHRARADRREAIDNPDAADAHAAKATDDTATDACNAPARDAAAATDDAPGEQDSAAQAAGSESAEEAASQGDAHQDTGSPAGGTVAAAVAATATATATAPSATTTGETETAGAAADPQIAGNTVHPAEGTAETAKAPVTAAVAAILADAAASTESAPDAGVTTSAAADAQPEATAVQPANGVFDQLTGNTTDQDRDEDSPSDAAAKAAPQVSARESFTAAVTQAADDRASMADTTQLAATPAPGATTTARQAELETARAAFTMGGGQDTPRPDTTDRIVQSMRFQFQRGGGDAIVHIKPEHLGPLSIALRVENGVVQAHVTTDNPVVAEWLKANEETLREGLKASGLALDRLVVDPDSSGRAPQRDWSQARRAQRRRFNTDPQSTFELTV